MKSLTVAVLRLLSVYHANLRVMMIYRHDIHYGASWLQRLLIVPKLKGWLLEENTVSEVAVHNAERDYRFSVDFLAVQPHWIVY